MEQAEQTEECLDSMGYLAARRDLLKSRSRTIRLKGLLELSGAGEAQGNGSILAFSFHGNCKSINRVILGQDAPDELEQLSNGLAGSGGKNYEKE